MERADNTETGLEQKVRHWLEVSGKKSELQAKLRAELYGAIQTEIAFRGDINVTGEVERRSVSHREKIINWLVSQHLTSNRHWLTNSVFVSEGEILPSPSPSQITSKVGGNLKQYETEVATPELVGTLLSDLGIESRSEVSQEIISRYSAKKQSIISTAFSILANQDRHEDKVTSKSGVNRGRELSVGETLKAIDKKYENILEDFSVRRREVPTRDPGPQVCIKCDYLEEALRQVKKLSPPDSDSSLHIEGKHKKSSRSNKKRDQSSSSPEIFQNEKFDLLSKKMDELIASKEKDLTVIDDLKRKLEESEEKILGLKEEMMERELSLKEERYEEKINNLQQIIQNQSQNIQGQSNELLKLRNEINLKDLTEKTKAVSRDVKEAKHTTDCPTVDFLESVKNKLGSLEKEERSIEDDFDDLWSSVSPEK